MIDDPDRWAPGYAEAGARNVTFHAEAAAAPIRTAQQIRALGARAGLAVKPTTAVEPYLDLLPEFDMILVMTVEPGFGGQPFLASCLPKVRRVREAVRASGLDVWVQVDGGVSAQTIEQCAEAGADVFVAGSAVYGADDAAAGITALRELAAAACTESGTPVFHLALQRDLAAAQASADGFYRVSTLGRTLEQEGFIHSSFAHQVAATAQAFYSGVEEPLALLRIDPARQSAPLRVEGGFPHFFGPIDLSGVVVTPVTRGADGTLVLPDLH
jgi:ribulose-phosphate 3-epimerase